MLHMMQVTRIHTDKRPRRIHYIPEWAEKRGFKQADIVRELGADKATVSRWFSGQLPQDKWLEPLAMFLRARSVQALFTHPDDDWLAEFFEERSVEERRRAISILENAFPKRRA